MSIRHGSLDQGMFSGTEIFCVMERKCLNAFLDSFAVSLFTNSIRGQCPINSDTETRVKSKRN